MERPSATSQKTCLGRVYPSPRDRGGMVQPKELRKKAAAVVMDCRGFLFGAPAVGRWIWRHTAGKEAVFMRRGRNRGVSLLLALTLLLGLLPGTAWAAGTVGHVTFSIETKTINGEYLVEPMEEELYPGDTVYTILSRVAGEEGILVTGADTGYISEIGGFSALQYGEYSGWLILLNGDYETWPLPELKNGDIVRFCYTYKTYGHDIVLIDLVEELYEKVEEADSYNGDNSGEVTAATEAASTMLDKISEFDSYKEYIDGLDTMVYGPGSDAAKIQQLITRLNIVLDGDKYVPVENVTIKVLDESGIEATEYVAGRSYQLQAVYTPENASWQNGDWDLETGMGADATVSADGILTITGINDDYLGGLLHMLTIQYWHPECKTIAGCYTEPLKNISGPQNPADYVNVAANQLTWDTIRGENTSSYAVTSNLTLPAQLTVEGETVAVSWSCDDTTGTVSVSQYNGEWSAYVVRPLAQDVSCTLTATLSYEEITKTKEFPVTVKAEGVSEDKESVVKYGDLLTTIAKGYTASTDAWVALEMAAYGGTKLTKFSGTDVAVALAEAATQETVNLETLSKHDYTNESWNIPYVLLAYDAVGADTAGFSNTREALKESLVSRLNNVGDSTDVEDVTPALAALAPYYNTDDGVKSAVDKGVAWLSQHQNRDGTFSSYGTSNANTTAMAVVALSALGIDAHTDSRFIKNNTSAVEGLFSFALADDHSGFGYKGNVTRDELATEQGFRALVAYARMKEKDGAYNIYLEAKNSKDAESPVPAPDISATPSNPGGGGTDRPDTEVEIEVSVMVPPKGGAEGQYTYRHDRSEYTDLLGGGATVTVSAGTSALSVLRSVLREADIDYTVSGGYVSQIGGLEEGDHGPNSGWQYLVDGSAPTESASTYTFQEDAEMVWYYTDDYTQEESGEQWSGSGGGEEPAVEAGENGTYQVAIPQGHSGPSAVEIPEARPGQLVVIVHEDGTEEVLKKALAEEGTVYLLLEEDARIRIVAYENDFQDVPEGSWYASAVDFAAGRGLLSGVSETEFAPEEGLSRGMLATALYALEEPGEQSWVSLFDDVAGGAWYARGTVWAAQAGIVSGYGDGTFGPEDPITREELAVMLYAYAGHLGLETTGRAELSGFADSGAVSPWAAQAVAWAVDAGILGGKDGDLLDPAGGATRAEAAAMLRALVAWMLCGQ